MKNQKNIVENLLYPPVWVIILLVAICIPSLTVVFINGLDTAPIAYGVYVLSSYTLCAAVIACIKVFPGCYRAVKHKVYGTKYGGRYMTDAAYRTHISLYISLTINLLYVITNLYLGIRYDSVWFITISVYYVILSAMRFLLLRFVNRNGIGRNLIREYRRSRLCGIILMTVNIALSGVVALVIARNEGFEYKGILIYVMAMYTFFITIKSAVNTVKYRKYNSPVMSTSKVISLAAALVSMLSLETAMLSQFGGENASPYFDRVMIGITGLGVSICVMIMSIVTIVRATKGIKEKGK